MTSHDSVTPRGCEEAREVARLYASAIEDLLTFADTVREDQLDLLVPIEQRTVRVMLYHLANGLRLSQEWLSFARRGAAVPPSDIDQANAQEARTHARATSQEARAIIDERRAAALEAVGTLTQEEWQRSVPFGPGGGMERPVARLATAGERHIRVHLEHITEALGLV